jgi:hypothetical protein
MRRTGLKGRNRNSIIKTPNKLKSVRRFVLIFKIKAIHIEQHNEIQKNKDILNIPVRKTDWSKITVETHGRVSLQ